MIESATTQITKRTYWQSKIKEWEESKLSQSAFCKQQTINLSTFGYWRSVFLADKNQEKNKFIPLKMIKDHSENKNKEKIKIKLLTGHIIYLPLEMNIADIARLIQSLGDGHA
jgi:hypothetical protein